MVFIPDSGGGFCIDKYENSPSTDCRYIFPMNQEDTRLNLENLDCKSVSQKGARPWVYVSRLQAEQLCARSGKRLLSPAEWHQAALGTIDTDACHLYKNWSMQPGQSGGNEECRTGLGIYDLIGNAWEWVSGQVKDGEYLDRKLPASGYIQEIDIDGLALSTDTDKPNNDFYQDYWWLKANGEKAIAKGGYYDSQERGGMFATYIELGPTESSIGTGFRCAR
jgi:formylglycine-generating enzyme required for sulfatase activity